MYIAVTATEAGASLNLSMAAYEHVDAPTTSAKALGMALVGLVSSIALSLF
jgi:hypothetical protein